MGRGVAPFREFRYSFRMNIALIPNLEKPDAVAAAQDLLDELSVHGQAEILANPGMRELQAFKPDLVIVLGGDGSILSIDAGTGGDAAVPVAGINFGKLGYMAAFSLVQFKEHLELILAGKGVADGADHAPRSDLPLRRETAGGHSAD